MIQMIALEVMENVSFDLLTLFSFFWQVEDIVARGDDADDERNLFDALDQDVDPEQITALRERNKKRLDALENKLKKLRQLLFPILRMSPFAECTTSVHSNQTWCFSGKKRTCWC
jgi:hypothetical protein